MDEPSHRTGKIQSGDVAIFYRAFGPESSTGKTPIIILHGSNYFDSYDWIGVATALASDREVVTPDRRGWGESQRSPSKDYSRDALLDDSLFMYARWMAAGSRAQIAVHPGAAHGFTLFPFALADAANCRIESYLSDAVRSAENRG